jgi:PLAT/LH2 domain
VKTSNIENAGTSAKVSITLYGEKKKSDLIELKNDDPKPFDKGKESTFKVRLFRPPLPINLLQSQFARTVFRYCLNGEIEQI